MTIIEELMQLGNPELAAASQTLAADCQQVQRRVLQEILQQAKDTELGRKSGFADIHGIDDFRQHMPLTTWADYEAYAERLKKGETDLTFPGKTHYFTLTSSTTSSQGKYVANGDMQTKAFQLIERMRQICYFMAEPRLLDGMLMPLVNTPESSTTEAGIPCGNASGMSVVRAGMEDKLAFPMSVFQIADSHERDYQMMVAAISHRNVYVLAGNNAGRMTLLAHMAQERRDDIIRDIAAKDPARAEELRALKDFTPAGYWPELKLALFWLSASVGKYVDELRPLLPAATRFMDVGYGSSESKFNIPLKPEEPSGLLSTATAFYEFLPVEGGTPVLAHQTQAGHDYELIITTWGGLYRYQMQDVVRVTGFVGTTPKIEFLYKSVEMLNMVDEKLPASIINDLLREYFTKQGTPLRQIQIYQDTQAKRYVCYIEPVAGHLPIGPATDETIDDLLAEAFIGYKMFKKEQHLLNTLTVIEMKQGWQDSLYAQAIKRPGMTNSQVKLLLIAKEPADKKWYYHEA